MRQHDQQRAYFWLGGSPCAGKSSIADWLVARYGLAYYQCDQFFGAHTGRATPETAPTLHQLGQFSWDEIWLEPVQTLLAREIAAYREEFPMIQADLAELMQTTTAPILVEGAALLPDLVVDLLPDLITASGWCQPKHFSANIMSDATGPGILSTRLGRRTRLFKTGWIEMSPLPGGWPLAPRP
jgi:hypothetical protein